MKMNINNVPSLYMTDDLIKDVMAPKLSLQDCKSLSKVCKQWNGVFTQQVLEEKLLDDVTFGKKKWLQVSGVSDVSDDPILNQAQKTTLINKLKEKCDFFNEPDNIQPHRFQKSTNNRFWQTRLVILFPEKINREPVDINRMGRIFSFEKEGDAKTVFDIICGNENEEYRNRPATRTYFAIVTLDVIPGSRRTSHEAKENLLHPKGYRVPTPLEAVISNLVMNLGPCQKKEGYFFGKEGKWWTYTATDELFNGYRLVVGAASSSGPGVDPDYGNAGVGAAAVEEVL